MADWFRSLASWNLLSTPPSRVAALVLVASLLDLGAGAGAAFLAGFEKVPDALGRFEPLWLLAMVGSLGASFVGYYLVYRELYAIEEGPGLSARQLRAAVVAGFGGLLAHGGSALDRYVLEGAGASEEEAKARVVALGGLEHGVLALGGCAAAIVVLVAGRSMPPLSFTLPWAILPVPGFLVGFLLAEHLAGRLKPRTGWRAAAAALVDGTLAIERLFRHPVRHASALGGMAIYWAGDFFAAWCGLAAFGVRLSGGVFVVGFATGMLFSRRTGPLAGAGTLMLVLSIALWASGSPFAATVVGIFTYRFLTLWLPLPFSLASMRTLRGLRKPAPPAGGLVDPPGGAALGGLEP